MKLLMETCQFRKNSHIYRNKVCTIALGSFSGNLKKEYIGYIYMSPVYVKITRSFLMYYNLQETPHTWPVSSIRGFACH